MKAFNSSEELLEKYALGIASEEEMKQVEASIAKSPQLAAALEEINQALEGFALAHKKRPRSSLKHKIMDAVFSEGESSSPHIQTEKSLAHWATQITEHRAPDDLDNIYSIQLEKTPERRTLLVWIKDKLPEETHDKYLESFLVLTGSCTCYFHGKEVRKMQAGDSMEIPLNTPHWIAVTSDEPLQLIVQRIAA